jgi:hypothetical protein
LQVYATCAYQVISQGTLDCFHVLPNMNDAVVNMDLQTYLHDRIFQFFGKSLASMVLYFNSF